MVQTEQITFYTNVYSPFSQRVQIALEEAKAEYTSHSVNPTLKAEWYAKVNPIGKIPAITYGGPKVSPEAPSDESTKLAESLIILEFLADLFPESNLLPRGPVPRAKVRFFMYVFETRVLDGFKNLIFIGGSSKQLLDGFDALQGLLPSTGFIAGDKLTIGDMAVAPFLVRVYLLLGAEIGKYPLGEGKKTLEILRSAKFARLDRYFNDIKEQPSFKGTWNEDIQLAMWYTNPVVRRK